MTSPTLHETSAGGVLIRRFGAQDEVCLVLRRRSLDSSVWGLPKGHLEAGEDAAAAALREVQEETGWTGEILEPLGAITYQFTNPGERTVVSKTVSYFLMRALGEVSGSYDTREVTEVRWMSLADALTSLAYDNERRILRQAKEILSKTSNL